jgi:TatD DNase family protein
MKYFDAHCHVQFDAYDADRAAVLERMREAEVGGLVVGVNFATSKAAIELVKDKSDLWASIGLHPNDTQHDDFNFDEYADLAQQEKVVAIGECGLDYFRPIDVTPEVVKRQKDVLEKHIELAVKYDKPLMIHSRPRKGQQDAYHDTIDMLQSAKREHGDKLKGDMHFFVGGIEEARQFVELDFTMSYTAVLTFARDYDEVVKFLPLTHILSETDSPYVAPPPNRGKRNEPTAVRDVVEAIAGIRGEEIEAVRMALLRNATRIFRIPL